jgi:hypothetical protein
LRYEWIIAEVREARLIVEREWREQCVRDMWEECAIAAWRKQRSATLEKQRAKRDADKERRWGLSTYFQRSGEFPDPNAMRPKEDDDEAMDEHSDIIKRVQAISKAQDDLRNVPPGRRRSAETKEKIGDMKQDFCDLDLPRRLEGVPPLPDVWRGKVNRAVLAKAEKIVKSLPLGTDADQVLRECAYVLVEFPELGPVKAQYDLETVRGGVSAWAIDTSKHEWRVIGAEARTSDSVVPSLGFLRGVNLRRIKECVAAFNEREGCLSD